MIHSMTGFGKSVVEFANKKITIEIKSLNSKQLDLNTRVPNIYKEYELTVRNIIGKCLVRGKVDLLVYIENLGLETNNSINENVVLAYKQQIESLAQTMGIATPSDWFSVLMRLPDVMKYENQEVDKEEFLALEKGIYEAIEKLNQFRLQEGQILEKLFTEKIDIISNLLIDVEKFDGERIANVKQKMQEAIQKNEITDYDTNRFEQELIYYIEKLDVNEEKVRLNNHLHYFLKTMKEEDAQGKKLNFISQEMGREINTLGSKANHANMQQIVVCMKDELEQIKEQILNVL